jgi:hypothetical protein
MGIWWQWSRWGFQENMYHKLCIFWETRTRIAWIGWDFWFTILQFLVHDVTAFRGW